MAIPETRNVTLQLLSNRKPTKLEPTTLPILPNIKLIFDTVDLNEKDFTCLIKNSTNS